MDKLASAIVEEHRSGRRGQTAPADLSFLATISATPQGAPTTVASAPCIAPSPVATFSPAPKAPVVSTGPPEPLKKTDGLYKPFSSTKVDRDDLITDLMIELQMESVDLNEIRYMVESAYYDNKYPYDDIKEVLASVESKVLEMIDLIITLRDPALDDEDAPTWMDEDMMENRNLVITGITSDESSYIDFLSILTDTHNVPKETAQDILDGITVIMEKYDPSIKAHYDLLEEEVAIQEVAN